MIKRYGKIEVIEIYPHMDRALIHFESGERIIFRGVYAVKKLLYTFGEFQDAIGKNVRGIR